MNYGSEWHLIRRAIKQRAGGQCEYVYANGRRCTQSKTLECHHVTYKRFRKEASCDLLCLCSLHHKKIHGKLGEATHATLRS